MSSFDDWLVDPKSNRFIQTYLRGYLDISGGHIILRNNDIYVNDGDISLNGRLLVSGDASLNSKLFVADDVCMNELLLVGNDVSFNSKLFVANDVCMNKILIVGGDTSLNSKLFVADDVCMNELLMVGGDASLNSKLFVADDVCMNELLIVGGDTSLNSKLFVNKDASFNSNVDISGDLVIHGTLGVYQQQEVKVINTTVNNYQLIVTEDISLNGNLFVSDDVSINSNLFVADDVCMNKVLIVGDDVSFNSDLFVNGDLSLNGNLDVDGNSKLKNLYVREWTVLRSTLDVSKSVVFSSTLDVSGATNIRSTLDVSGATKLASTLYVSKAVRMDDTLTVENDVSMNSNLYVTQNTYIDEKLHVKSDVSMDTIFTLGGDASLNSKLFVASDVCMNEVLMVGGDVSLNSKLFVADDVCMNQVLMVGGDVSLNSKMFVASDVCMNELLMVGGDTSLNSKLFVANDVCMNQVLMVGNDVSFNSDLFVDGDLSLNGDLSVGGDIKLTNLLVRGWADLRSTLDVSKNVTLGSTLDVSSNVTINNGDITLNNGGVTMNDISFGVSNLPTSVTGDFDGNQKILYSEYSGMERVFNGIYEVSASSVNILNIGKQPWNVFNSGNNNWQSESTYQTGNYIGDISTNYLDNSNNGLSSKGEYIEISFPFKIQVDSITIRTDSYDAITPSITKLHVLGYNNNNWKELLVNEGTIQHNSTDTENADVVIYTEFKFYIDKIRIIVNNVNTSIDYFTISKLAFSGDVIGSKISLDNGNIGIGNVNPRSALEITGNMLLSNAINNKNTSGDNVEHGRIMWGGIGRDISNNNHSSYIRSYFENGSYDTSGNLAFGTSDGVNVASDKFVINAKGVNNFITDVSMNENLTVDGKINNAKIFTNAGSNSNLLVGIGTVKEPKGENNIGFGSNVFSVSSMSINAKHNTAFGNLVLQNITSGSTNSGAGTSSLSNTTTGSDNVAMGNGTLRDNTSGSKNIAIGKFALRDIEEGQYNSAFGYEAGISIIGNNTVKYNTFLGAETNFDNVTNKYQYSTALGYGAKITDSRQIMLGTASETVVAPGDVSINGVLDVSGGSKIVIQGGQDGGPGRGIYMWSKTNTSSAIYMGQPGTGKSLSGGNACSGANFQGTSFPIRFRSLPHSGYGFIFENSSEELLSSIRGSDGSTYFKGNVGIGAIDESHKLHVDGTALITGDVSMSSNLDVNKVALYTDDDNNAYFAHTSRKYSGVLHYALKQESEGHTTLNAMDDKELRLAINNTTKMVLDANGNLGIGTTNPSTALDVNGDITVGGSSGIVQGGKIIFDKAISADGPNKISLYGDNTGYGIGVDGSTVKYLTGGPNHKFYYGSGSSSNGTLAMTLNQNDLTIEGAATVKSTLYVSKATTLTSTLSVDGNVGIGTTTPSYALDINDGIIRTNYTASSIIRHYPLRTNFSEWSDSDTVNSQNYISIQTGEGGYTRLTYDSWITSPAFDLNGYAFYTDGSSEDNKQRTNGRILLKMTGRSWSEDTATEYTQISILDANDSDSVIDVIYKENGDSQSVVDFYPIVCDLKPYLTSSVYNIKIKLHLNANGPADYFDFKDFSICIDDNYPWYKSSVYKQQILGGASIGVNYVGKDLNSNELLVEGNVGIGTDQPSRKLDVSGNALVTGDVSMNNNLIVSNKITATDLSINNNLIIGGNGSQIGIEDSNLGLTILNKVIIGNDNISGDEVLTVKGKIRAEDLILSSTGEGVQLTTSKVGSIIIGSASPEGDRPTIKTVTGSSTSISIHTKATERFTIDGDGNARFNETLTISKATTLNSTLAVSKAATLNSTLAVSKATTMKSILNVSKAATMASTLDVSKAATMASTLNVSKAATMKYTLYVSNAATMASTLYVSKATTLSSTLDVTNGLLAVNNGMVKINTGTNTDIHTSDYTTDNYRPLLAVNSHIYTKGLVNYPENGSGPAAIDFISHDTIKFVTNGESRFTIKPDGNIDMYSGLFIDNDLSLNSHLYVNKATTLKSTLYVSKATALKSTLEVSNAAIVKSTLNVSKAATMKSTLDVTGASTLSSTLAVTNAATMKSTLNVSKAATMASTLDVTGASTLSSTLAVTNAATMKSTLNVSKAATMASTLDVTGASTLSSTLAVTNAATMKSTLNVSKAATMKSTLNVSDDVSFNSKLSVGNDASFNSNLTVSGDLTVYGNLDVNKIQNTTTTHTTVNDYSIIVSEDISLNNDLNVSGNANFANKLDIQKDGDVTVLNKNLVIGGSVYLSTMVANSIFDGYNAISATTNFLTTNDFYTITSSSYNNAGTGNHSIASVFINNNNSWKSGLVDQVYTDIPKITNKAFDSSNNSYLSSDELQIIYNGSFSTSYYNSINGNTTNISGEYIEIVFPNYTRIDSYQLHTDTYQVPSYGLLLGYDDTNTRWTLIHTYDKTKGTPIVPPTSFSFPENINDSFTVITTKKIRFVINQIQRNTHRIINDIYEHNVAIRYINFAGTFLDSGISVGAGYSQNTANTSMGFGTLTGNIDGKNNIALGNYTLSQTRTSDNIAIGYNSLVNNTIGKRNISIGTDTMISNKEGNNNTTLGHETGYSNQNGDNNTFIGYHSGYSNVNGSNNTFIGYNTNSNGAYSNSTAIGSNATVTANNQIVIGTTDDTIKIPGIIEIDNAFNNDVSMNSNLYVNGDVSFNSKLFVDGASTLNSLIVHNNTTTKTLTVTNISTFNNELKVTNGGIVTNEIEINGNSTLNGILDVTNASTLKNTLNVAKSTTLSSTLIVAKDVSLNSKLYVVNDVSLNSKLNVGGNTKMDGSLDVTGNTQLNGLTMSGNATIANNLTTTGNINFDGLDSIPKLSITTGSGTNKTTTLVNNTINMGTTANAINNTNFVTITNDQNSNNPKMSINGTSGLVALSVTGTIEGTDVRITGGGTIQTTGETITTSIRTLVGDLSHGMALQPINYADIRGNDTDPPAAIGLQFIPQIGVDTTSTGVDDASSNNAPILYDDGYINIDASGKMLINQDLTVNQNTVLNKFTTTGDTSLNNLNVTNASSLKSTLYVSGATSLASSLTVTGNSSVSNLTVDNATTLKSILNVSKTTTLLSSLNVSGSTSLNNTLTVSKATSLKSNLDICGNVSIENGDFTINDVSFNVTDLPTSVTGDFESNQLILYSQYSGMERVFNGIYDISASSSLQGNEPWKAFDLSDGTYWSTDTGKVDVPTSKTTYRPKSTESAIYLSAIDLSGEYVQIEYPFYMKVNEIRIASFDDNLVTGEGIIKFKLLGIKNNEWYEIHHYEGDAILSATSVTVSSSFYSNKYRLVIPIEGIDIISYVSISHLSFNGDVLGSKIHIDNANLGIGNVNPRSALEITGNMLLSNAINGVNTSGDNVEHGRIMWGGINRDISNNNHSSYIRSYFEEGSYDTSGNLAFGTSDGVNVASDKFVINAKGVNNFITDVSMDSNLMINGDVSFNNKLYVKNNVWVDGSLGIGTNDPKTSLHIEATDALKIPVGSDQDKNNFTASVGHIRYNTTTSQYEGYSSGAWGSLGGIKDVDQDTYISAENSANVDNDELKFFTNGVERMRIGANGDASFNGKLHIYETTGTTPNTNAQGSLVLEHGNAGGTSSITFVSAQDKSSDYGYIKYSDNTGTSGTQNSILEIGVQNDKNESQGDNIILKPSQNVGIGDLTTPKSKLSVNGNLFVGETAGQNNAPNNGLYVQGNVGIGSWPDTLKLAVGGSAKITGKINGITLLSNDNSNNLIIGNGSIIEPTGESNVGFGKNVLNGPNNSGSKNVAMGNDVLTQLTTGQSNVAIGTWSQIKNKTGDGNVSVGLQSLGTTEEGSSNTAIGTQALQEYLGSGTTAIGSGAGRYGGGWGNAFIGCNTGFDVSTNTYSNSTALGYGAEITASRQIMLGTSGETVVVPGDASFNDNLNVDGASTMKSTLYVSKATTLSSTLDVSNGLLAVNYGMVKINTGNDTGIHTSGYTNDNNRPLLAVNSHIYTKGLINYPENGNGPAAIDFINPDTIKFVTRGNDRFTIQPDGNINMASGLFINNDLSINNDLYVNKASTMKSTLYVSKATTLKSTLNINGKTTLVGDLSMNGDMKLDGNVDISGDLVLQGNLTVVDQINETIINTTVNNYSLIVTEDLSLNGELHVSGDASLNGELYIRGASTLNSTLNVNNNTLWAGANGLVGIGTTNTTDSKLYVYGKTYLSGKVGIGDTPDDNTSYILDVCGNVNATSYNAASDYRIKENVVPISDTSYNIDNLRPVTYTNIKMEKQDFGVIAHELQEQIPFLVTGEKDGEHHQSVNYNGLIGLLLNEVQQLKKRVQELEKSKP